MESVIRVDLGFRIIAKNGNILKDSMVIIDIRLGLIGGYTINNGLSAISIFLRDSLLALMEGPAHFINIKSRTILKTQMENITALLMLTRLPPNRRSSSEPKP